MNKKSDIVYNTLKDGPKKIGKTHFSIIQGNKLRIRHTGNPGDRIWIVHDNSEKFFGFNPFKDLRMTMDTGDPDSLYVAIFKLEEPTKREKEYA